MSNELKSAIAESLPADGNSASSTEIDGNPSAPAETTAQQVEQENVPFNQHPRFRQIIEERDKAREERDQARIFATQISETLKTVTNRPIVVQNQQQEPQIDPYAGMDEDAKKWAMFIDQRAEQKAKKIIDSVRPEFEKELSSTKEALAMVAYREFQRNHPDVIPGSPEENSIADKVNKGYNLEDAYKIVMFDRVSDQKTQQVIDQNTQKMKTKQLANSETQAISPTSTMQPKSTKGFRELMAEGLG